MLQKNTIRISSLLCILMIILAFVMMPVSTVFAETNIDDSDKLISVTVPNGVKGDAGINVKKAIDAVLDKYAKEQDHKVTPAADGGYTGTNEDMYVSTSGEDKLVAKYDSANSKFTISKKGWDALKDKEKTKVMKTFVDELKSNSDVNDDALQTFINDIQEQNTSVGSIMLPMIMEGTKADLYAAYKAVEPFLDVLNVILGIGCVILILLLLASTVMDLAYIGLPVWREAQANKSGGGKHPFGVSYEALTTVQEIEKGIGGGDGGYKNSYVLYFKRRALTYIVLALCIMYLICGGISGIIAFVLSLTSGIV